MKRKLTREVKNGL